MAKDEPKKRWEQLTEQEVNREVGYIQNGTMAMRGFVAQQLMVFAVKNNGAVDITNNQFTDGIVSLKDQTKEKQLRDNPKATGGVLSLAQAEIDMTKDIADAVARGADPAIFQPAKDILASVTKELTDKLGSNAGVASLIGEYVLTQGLSDGIPFMDAATGRGPVPQEKIKLIGQLTPYIKFPDNVSPFITTDLKFTATVMGPPIRARMAEFFSVEGKLSEFGSCTLDPAKMTPENMKKFGDIVSKDLEIIAVVEQGKKETKTRVTSIIEESIKDLEKKGHKFSAATRKEMFAELMPALTSLGSEYLEANKSDLSKGLTASLNAGKSFSFRFKEDFTIAEKDLHSVATKISTGHLTKSNEAAEKQYHSRFSKMGANLGSDTKFSQNLNNLLEARGEKPISLEQFKKLSDKDLAQHRKVDPKEFDKVIFGIGAAPVVDKAKPVVKEVPVEVIVPPKPEKLPEGPPSRLAPPIPPRRPISAPPSLITPVQVQPAPKLENVSVVVDAVAIGKATAIIDASIKAEGHRITPERVAKITKALAPTLAKLGADYLEKNQAGLTKDLVASLKAGQGYSTSFTGSYTVSTAELGKIAAKMEKQHKPQAKQPVSKVKDTPPKLSPKLVQQASNVGHSHNLPHPPPGRGGQTTKPKPLPPTPKRPQSQGPSM